LPSIDILNNVLNKSKMKKLNPEFKTKWLELLRSGKFKQGPQLLHDKEKDTYCCLGIGLLACGYSKDEIKGSYPRKDSYPDFPEDILEQTPKIQLGFSEVHQGIGWELAAMNDKRVPFSDIADIIEKEL
jgi:hypothetical protein